MASSYDFKPLIQGNTFKGLIMDIGTEAGPLDLTGYNIRLWLRKSYTSPPVLKFSTEDNTIEVLSALEGRYMIKPRNIDLVPYNYVYDIKFELGNFKRTRVKGFWPILPRVTI